MASHRVILLMQIQLICDIGIKSVHFIAMDSILACDNQIFRTKYTLISVEFLKVMSFFSMD